MSCRVSEVPPSGWRKRAIVMLWPLRSGGSTSDRGRAPRFLLTMTVAGRRGDSRQPVIRRWRSTSVVRPASRWPGLLLVRLSAIGGRPVAAGSGIGIVAAADVGECAKAVIRRTPSSDAAAAHYGTLLAETITAIVPDRACSWSSSACGWAAGASRSPCSWPSWVSSSCSSWSRTPSAGRGRPVPRLDQAPPTSSFPSGHTAAAVALYGCVALVVLRQMANRWLGPPDRDALLPRPRDRRGLPGVPRHALLDRRDFGAIGGGIWLLVTVLIVLPPATYGRRRRPPRHPPLERAARMATG